MYTLDTNVILYYLRGDASVISVDGLLADRAGTIGRTHKVELADSVIAATALFTGSTLLTRNTRDFRRVPSLSLQKI